MRMFMRMEVWDTICSHDAAELSTEAAYVLRIPSKTVNFVNVYFPNSNFKSLSFRFQKHRYHDNVEHY